jgi:hypothetical protein
LAPVGILALIEAIRHLRGVDARRVNARRVGTPNLLSK